MEETKKGKSATVKQYIDDDITFSKSMMTNQMVKYNMKNLI